jgi:fatty acyl-ACP thioesterase B
MMNKVTRKLARIPDEVRTEIEPYFFERSAIVDEDNRKLPKLPEEQSSTADKYVRTGLTVSYFDQYLLQAYSLFSFLFTVLYIFLSVLCSLGGLISI